jgi:DNA-directed RNA polymerase omega subunit
MNVKTIIMSDLFKRCDDIYTATMIVAKRAKQIIDERVVPIDENEDVEDSIEFEEPIVTTFVDKPESIALKEFINGELQWRAPCEDAQPEDES